MFVQDYNRTFQVHSRAPNTFVQYIYVLLIDLEIRDTFHTFSDQSLVFEH